MTARFLACGAVLAAASPVSAAPAPAAAITALIARADTLAQAGDFKQSLALAAEAEARAAALRPANRELRFLAARRYVITFTYAGDAAAIPAQFERLAVLADTAYGAGSFAGRYARFKAAQYAAKVAGPASNTAALAAAAEALAASARDEEERTLAAQSLAVVANNLSLTDLPAAQPLAERARAMVDAMPGVTAVERGQVYQYLTAIASRSDRPQDTLALSRQAVAIFEVAQGKRSQHLVRALSFQAAAYRALGDHSRTEALLRRAVDIVDAQPGIGDEHRARALLDYGRYLASRGQTDLALPLLRRATDHARKLPPGDAFTQSIYLTAGRIWLQAGQPQEALLDLRFLLTIAADAASAQIAAQTLGEIARAELQLGNLAAAEEAARDGLSRAEAHTPPGHSARGTVRMILADVLDARGQPAAAASLYAVAVGELGRQPGDAARARIRRAATLVETDTLDEPGWRAARAGSDALAAALARAAQQLGTERLALPPQLMDDALDVAWQRARAVARR